MYVFSVYLRGGNIKPRGGGGGGECSPPPPPPPTERNPADCKVWAWNGCAGDGMGKELRRTLMANLS